MSRICEEFHCLPSQALRELETDPDRLVLEILPLRSFARAKEVYDRAKDKDDLPDSPAIELVKEIEFDLKVAAWRQRQQEVSGDTTLSGNS